MMLSFFDQFSIPTILGVPLIFIATIFPTLLIVMKNNRLVLNRLSALLEWSMKLFSKQLMLPINLPGHKWTAPLLSLMMLLSSLNMLGLLPYTFTPTTQLSFNMALAVPMWLAPEGIWDLSVGAYFIGYLVFLVGFLVVFGGDSFLNNVGVVGSESSGFNVVRGDFEGVSLLYGAGGAGLVICGWGLLLTLFVVLELTRGVSRGSLRVV